MPEKKLLFCCECGRCGRNDMDIPEQYDDDFIYLMDSEEFPRAGNPGHHIVLRSHVTDEDMVVFIFGILALVVDR